MTFSIFWIEARRSLKITLTLILCSFLSGFTVSSTWKLKNYIQSLFVPVSWNANLIVLPKAIGLEGLHRSLLKGQPEGLIPLALLETLQAQIEQEKIQRHLDQPSLRVLGFIPYEDQDGKTRIAYFGNKDAYFSESAPTDLWNQFSFEPWVSKNSELAGRTGYQTPEWGPKVMMGILAKGEPGPIERLKELIDRKTVAQGILVTPGMSETDHRLDQLGKSLYILGALIMLCLIPGLFLSLVILAERRSQIFTVLEELRVQKSQSLQIFILQILGLILMPLIAGFYLGIMVAPLAEELLKFS